MSEEIKWCKCGFKGVAGMFNKTNGSCPKCGKAILEGAANLSREELDNIKKDLPRGGQ